MTTLKTLAQIKSAGGVVSRQPVLRHIEWKTVNPETLEEEDFDAEILLVKMAGGALQELAKDETQDQVAMMISKSWMAAENEGDKPKFVAFDVAFNLDPALRAAIWNEVKLINGMERKNSPQTTNSGATSSAAESAVAQ